MSENALQRMERQEVAHPIQAGDAGSMLAIIARAAQDPNTDTAKMRELLAIRKELQAEEAKRLFDEAMTAFQARCPVIVKTKAVLAKDKQSVRYKFAPLDSIVAQTKDLMRELGFSYTIDASVSAAEKSVTAWCVVKHSGHEEKSTFAVPIDPEGYMSLPQKYASALTFAKRYAFCNAFGIMTADEDSDGDQGERKSNAKAEEELRLLRASIWNALKPHIEPAKDWSKVNQWLWQQELLDGAANEAMPDVPARKMAKLLEEIKKKLP